MRKVVVIPIIIIAVIIVSFSFMPILEQYHLFSFDQANEKRIGEGQKFTDASGKRCLLSETIAGDKCPSTSRGYNPDTGKYDTGERFKPYDPSSGGLSDEAFAKMINP